LSIEAAGRDFEVQRLDQLENKRRSKEEEEEKKKDRRKMKKIEESNPAAIMEQLSRANDPLSYRARTELSLPAPQVSDVELEQVLKVGEMAMIAADMDKGTSAATAGLVGDYSSRNVLPTPMRTPRVATGKDVILQESLNQLAMMNTKTPLLGGVNPELQEGTGFGGITPRSTALTTPNVLGTPLVGGATPSHRGGGRSGAGGGGATPLGGGATPLRDELGVNKISEWAPVVSGMSESSRLKHQKMQLSSSLAALPEPQYTYEVEVPNVKPDDEEDENDQSGARGSAAAVEDASERDARNLQIMKEAEAAEFARRNAAVRKDLPRPIVDVSELPAWTNTKLDIADHEVRTEMAQLLAHDTQRFPFVKSSLMSEAEKKEKKSDKKRRRGETVNLEEFTDGALFRAKQLIAAELSQDSTALKNILKKDDNTENNRVFQELWLEINRGMAYLPGRNEYAPLSSASANEKIAALTHQFDAIRGHMARHAEKCAKVTKHAILLIEDTFFFSIPLG
jgi:pre-mRNA-splicing factor CDC5/CEF1